MAYLVPIGFGGPNRDGILQTYTNGTGIGLVEVYDLGSAPPAP
jgi:hypothetical protein